MPRLSIIVTCYNIEQYVAQCLDSVLGQTLADIEVIVVDDGSTDGTPSVIRSVAEADHRLVPVLLDENSIGGVATAANEGLDRATSPYVGFVDGDDFCEPTMFQRLLDAALAHDADLAMCRYQLLDAATGDLSYPADEGRWAEVDQSAYRLDVDERKRFLRFVAVPWRKIYRRELLEGNGIRFPVGDYFYEDNAFHWFCLLSATSLAVVPEVLCYHRYARAGQTMGAADERLFSIFLHYDTIKAWIGERGLSADFGPSLLAWVISQMEWVAPRTPANLRRRLFDVLQPIVSPYDEHTVKEALTEDPKGMLAVHLVQALRDDNYSAFVKTLETEGRASNPLVSAVFYLRYSGLSETARLTRRYTRNKARDYRARYRRRRRQQPDGTDDILFALAVIETRLDAIERELQGLSGRES